MYGVDVVVDVNPRGQRGLSAASRPVVRTLSSTPGSSLPTIDQVVRDFVRLVHPDRYPDSSIKAANQEALSKFHQFMDCWKEWDEASEPQLFDLDFFIENRGGGASGSITSRIGEAARMFMRGGDDASGGSESTEARRTMRRVRVRLFLQPPVHSGHESLTSLLKACGLPSEFSDSSALRRGGEFSTLDSFLERSARVARAVSADTTRLADANVEVFMGLRRRHGLGTMFTDASMTESTLSALVERLSAMSERGVLDDMNLKGRDVVFTGELPADAQDQDGGAPRDESAAKQSGVDASGSIVLSAEESVEEWTTFFCTTDWADVALKAKARADLSARLAKKAAQRGRAVARILGVKSFDFFASATAATNAAVHGPPEALALLSTRTADAELRAAVQAAGLSRLGTASSVPAGPKTRSRSKAKLKGKPKAGAGSAVKLSALRVVVSSEPFLPGIRHAVSSSGEIIVDRSANAASVVEAVAARANDAALLMSQSGTLERSRTRAERALGLYELRAAPEMFERGAAEGLPRATSAFDRLADLAPQLGSVSVADLTIIVADRFAVDPEGKLIVPWDFEFSSFKQFLLEGTVTK